MKCSYKFLSVTLGFLLILLNKFAEPGRKKCIDNVDVAWNKCSKDKAKNLTACAVSFASSYTKCFFEKPFKQNCYKRCENKHKKCIRKKPIMISACNNGFNFCVNQCFNNFPQKGSMTDSCLNLCEGEYTLCEQLMQKFVEIFICISQREICRKSRTCYRRTVPKKLIKSRVYP